MGRLDRHSNGVVIATVTTTVVIILVVFITTERNVFLSRKSPPASEPPTDELPALPWALIDRQSYLSHRIVYTGGRHAKRLPGNVVPLHYDLEIEPHIGDSSSEEDTFSGKVTIRFRCIVATSTITVHSTPELKVSLGSRVTPGVIVRHASNTFFKMWAKSLTLHAYDEFLVIKLLGKLNANQTYLVTMHFHGKLGQDRGFYKYHYKVNGKLKHHKLVADHFQTTMPMSTYTLAFAVLNFTSQTNGNVTIWSLNDKAPYLKYALEVTPVLVKFYEELFGISYPLPKLNMISLPSFLADAMENWGLLTFHEQCLIFDETTTPHKKPLIVGLIAHEVAHQWFGDLVTMDWWGDVWLNEGFATYMQYTGAHFLEHQWEMMDLFVVNEMQPILKAESTTKMYPVSVDTNSTGHLDKLFDKILYSKAQRGLVDVKRVMRYWTKHAGYPLVTVNRLYGKASAVFSQQDYLTLANVGETAEKLPKNKSYVKR
ncbi:endoplasmic reticulum aminopeptidase 2-like [Ixodes scapularis]|uniref:endoplasmic reticulum aminopeptidase 2-like n=1 Tax=Ixodes scapularis TaxID=6945 RepID=UPI001A9EABE3|nr:endoplasmic reticulum aminopeptidase 2-like [Ixodes scapularis]